MTRDSDRQVLVTADSKALDAAAEARVMKEIDDHETRIRDMERQLWKMAWVNVCAGIFVTIFTGVCTWTVTTSMQQVVDRVTAVGRKP